MLALYEGSVIAVRWVEKRRKAAEAAKAAEDGNVTPRDTLAAISVAVVWGLMFIAIKIGVGETSPLMLSALRFVFASLPAVFFVAPPKAPAWKVALYGLLIGVGQFGVLFIAMREGFPVGLASLVIQLQVFFTILLAWMVLGERPRADAGDRRGDRLRRHGGDRLGPARPGRASGRSFWSCWRRLFWGAGNVVAKTAGKIDALAFTVWSSLAAPLPLLALSLVFDGAAPLVGLAASDLAARRQRR